MTTLNPVTEITSPARLIQSAILIRTGSCTVNMEKGSATLTLFRGDTTVGAPLDRVDSRGFLEPAMSHTFRSVTPPKRLPEFPIPARPTASAAAAGLASADHWQHRQPAAQLRTREVQPRLIVIRWASALVSGTGTLTRRIPWS